MPLLDVQLVPSAPKVLNFIWFGKKLPENYQENILSWKKLNPDYKINIWSSTLGMANSKDLDFLDNFCQQHQFNFMNIDTNISLPNIEIVKKLLLENYSWRYACASDILRVSILLTQGGYYLDTDYKAIRSFGNLACPYGFLQFFKKHNDRFGYNNSIQAALPLHPVYAMAAYILKKNAEIFFKKSEFSSFWQSSDELGEINNGVILSFGLAIQQAINHLVARHDLHQDTDTATRINFSDYAADRFDLSYELQLLSKNENLIKKDKIYISMSENEPSFTYTLREVNGSIKTGKILFSDLGNFFGEKPSTIERLTKYIRKIIEIIAESADIRMPTNWRFGLDSRNSRGSMISYLRKALDEASEKYFPKTSQSFSFGESSKKLIIYTPPLMKIAKPAFIQFYHQITEVLLSHTYETLTFFTHPTVINGKKFTLQAALFYKHAQEIIHGEQFNITTEVNYLTDLIDKLNINRQVRYDSTTQFYALVTAKIRAFLEQVNISKEINSQALSENAWFTMSNESLYDHFFLGNNNQDAQLMAPAVLTCP